MTDTYEINGATFLAQNDMIVKWIRAGHGEFEPATTKWLFTMLESRSGAFVDVGASTGWFTVPVAMTGRKVHAVEPNARVLERLAANCALNGVSPEIHPVAASDKIGTAIFHYNPMLPLTSGGSLEDVAGGRAHEEVHVMPLDAIIDDEVALIKMDVEGHEITALAGAVRLVETWRPPLILEANTEDHVAVLADWLDRMDYAWMRADTRNMLCLPKSSLF
jgi:FkbM family methyltransferase